MAAFSVHGMLEGAVVVFDYQLAGGKYCLTVKFTPAGRLLRHPVSKRNHSLQKVGLNE